MPPKKKKKGKGKGSAKKNDQASAGKRDKSAASVALTELSKEFYLVQIKDLEQRLHRYQTKCDELEIVNHDVVENSDKLKKDRDDLVNLLQSQLDERAERIADLQEMHSETERQLASEQKEHEAKMQAMRSSAQEREDQLKAEVAILTAELESVQDFKETKEKMEAELLGLKCQLTENERLHQDVLYQLERKAVQDMNRLKKEMEKRVSDVAAEFRKVSNRQMAETTKRAIRENVAISSQLGKMSDKTMELVHDNDEMKKKEKEYRMRIGILEASEKELAKKHLSSERIVQMMVDKATKQEKLLEEYMTREAEWVVTETEVARVAEDAEAAHHQLEMMQGQLLKREEELKQLNSRLTDTKDQNQQLIDVLAQTAETVQSALKISSSDSEVPLHEAHYARDNMLSSLLGLLDSAAASGIILGPAHLSSDKRTSPRHEGKIKRQQQRPPSRPGHTITSHYLPGDLGIIPKVPKSLGPVRNRQTRTVGVQTTATGKPLVISAEKLKKDMLQKTLPSIGSAVSIGKRF